MSMSAGGAVMAAGAAISLVSRTIVGVGQVEAKYQRDGDLTVIGAAAPAVGVDEWLAQVLQGAGAGDPYEIIARFRSGDPLTGGDPTDIWLPFQTENDVLWSQNATTVDRTTVLDVSIRRLNTTLEEGPATLTLTSIAPT